MNKWLLLCLLAFTVQAKDLTVRWELATERMDATPLPVSEIASTRVEWGTCSGLLFGTSLGTRDVAAPAVSTVVTLDAGTYCFRGFTVDTEGLVSDSSNVAQKVVKGRPKPPKML